MANLPNRDGAWCWFQDPRATHFVGTYNKTYVGYVKANGSVAIWEYNHSTHAHRQTTLHSSLEVDDHAAPAILVLPSGYILVFYIKHAASPLYMRKSLNVEDISAFGAEQDILSDGPGPNYPCPVRLSSGRIFVFYREGGANDSDIYYIYSDDDGDSWSAAAQLTNWGSTGIYFKVAVKDNEIHIAATTRDADVEQDIYYFYTPDGGTTWKKRDGTVLGVPITPGTAELIYDTPAESSSWVWDIALDADKYPWVAFADELETADHKYKCVKWDGDSWDVAQIVASNHGGLYGAEPSYSGGVQLDHDDTTQAYCAVYVDGNFEIQRFQYAAGSWSKAEDITSGTAKWNIRPVYVRNAHSGMKVVWMYGDYVTYTNYSTIISSLLQSGTVVSKQVAASTDDCFRRVAPPYFGTTPNICRAGSSSVTDYDFYSGARFLALAIPPRVNILTAYFSLECTVDQKLAGGYHQALTKVRVEDTDDAVTFSTEADFLGRARTAGVDWDIDDWLAGKWYESPDIASQIQIAVNRPGWESGNDLVVFWEDDESPHADKCAREAWSWDESPNDKGPKLYIEWETPPATRVPRAPAYGLDPMIF